MSKTEHTPTPWVWSWIDGEDEDEGNQWVEIHNEHNDEVAVLMVRNATKWRAIVGPEREANARFIVTACNVHDPLVEALRDIAIAPCLLALLGEESTDGPCTCPGCRARAALALTETD